MLQYVVRFSNQLGVLVLLTASFSVALAQNPVASLRGPNSGLRPSAFAPSESSASNEQATIVARFVAAETKAREAINQHTFKRDVVLQTIGPKGEVTGEYVRNSQFIFDDRGRRIERVLFRPPSTIREMRITKEDILDLEGSQLLGIDIVEATKYQLTYAGAEIVDARQLIAVDVAPLIQPDPRHMKDRFFVGRVWIDPTTFQILKIKGVVEPQGKQRFPMFMTWREPIKDALAFPTRTEADDILHFQERDVHYRIKVRYYDYKEFASKVSVKDVDEDAPQLEEDSPKKNELPVKTKTQSKSDEAPSVVPGTTSQRLRNAEVCTTNRNAPPVGPYHWPVDTEVKVYFTRNMFTPEQSTVLLEAMKTWNMVGEDNGSGVRFIYAGESDSRATCRNCLTVSRRDVFARDKHHYAFFHPMNQEEGRLLVSAWIDLDVGITDPKALQGFMAHELGHGLGLWDCPSCKNKRSLMNSFPGLNKNNGLVAPSSCDVATMKNVYQEERQIASAKSYSDKQPGTVPAGSALALPTLGLEKAAFSMRDMQRPMVGGATAAKSFGDKLPETVPVDRTLSLPSLGPAKASFEFEGLQVHRSLFSWGRIF
jgi:hypothetical protein